jgi:5'-nucleotidase
MINPRILITNDDGIDAPGLEVLQTIARQISDDVWTVAPKENMSGVGHKLSFQCELELEKIAPKTYAVPGTPADCVVVGCTHLLNDKKPDVVLSGVNRGQNLGDLIHCSGTIGGAREGVLQGAIGIALSQAMNFEELAEIDWSPTIDHGASTIQALIAAANGADVVYNVNFPMTKSDATPPIEVVPHQRFSISPFRYYASQNAGKFFISIPETPMPLDHDSDFHVLHADQKITVTPILLQQSDAAEMARLSSALKAQ